MSEHVYKVVELVGSSKEGIEDAVQNAVKRADETLRNLRWFEIVQIRGHVEDRAHRITGRRRTRAFACQGPAFPYHLTFELDHVPG